MEKRYNHGSVSMGNKMFVIGGYNISTCEIFDSFSRNFIYTKPMNFTTEYRLPYGVVCIGQTFVVFYKKPTKPYGTKIFIYDVLKNQWTENYCSVLKNLTGISCAKYYEE